MKKMNLIVVLEFIYFCAFPKVELNESARSYAIAWWKNIHFGIYLMKLNFYFRACSASFFANIELNRGFGNYIFIFALAAPSIMLAW